MCVYSEGKCVCVCVCTHMRVSMCLCTHMRLSKCARMCLFFVIHDDVCDVMSVM